MSLEGEQSLAGKVVTYLVRLGGGDAELVTTVPSARPRFVQMACLLLVSAATATISMFFALQNVLGTAPWSALFAVGWGAAILAIDRWSVTSMPAVRGRVRLLLLVLPRIALAALIGTVIATPIVLRIFSTDIQSQVHRVDTQQLTRLDAHIAAASQVVAGHLPASSTSPELEVARNRVNSLAAQLKTALQSQVVAYDRWQCELYGTGPNCRGTSGIPGDGPQARQDEEDYQQAVQLVQSLNVQLHQAQDALTKAEASALAKAQQQAVAQLHPLQSEHAALSKEINGKIGILAQLQALGELSSDNPSVAVARYSLFFLFFLIEILPTAASIRLTAGPESAYDVAFRTREQELLGRQLGRLDEATARKAEILPTSGPLSLRAATPSEYLVDEHRRLTDHDPALMRREVAASLNNLGVLYSALGRQARSLETSREAVEVYRDLATTNQKYTADLAGSLSNLGTRYAELGNTASALEVAEEAVALYRSLDAKDPGQRRALASTLNNFGVRLAEAGRAMEALDATREAVELYRSLAPTYPDVLPDLAGSLSNLGTRHAGLGQTVQALEAIREAIALHQSRRPDDPTFIPSLAASLNNLGVQYASLGRAADALEVTEEAVAKYRDLVADNPTFLPDLAGTLSNLGALYVDLGRPADALPVAEEAVTLLTELSAANPGYTTQLAAAAANLATAFQARYRDTGAEADLNQAVELLQQALAKVPADYQDRPALLSNLAAAFQARYRSSSDPTDLGQAVRLLQEALAAAPADYQDRPAILSNLAKISALEASGGQAHK